MAKSKTSPTKAKAAKKTPTIAKPAKKNALVAKDLPISERIMIELAKLYLLGMKDPKTIVIAQSCGFTNVETKSFRNAKTDLKTQGRVAARTGDTIRMTTKTIALMKEDSNAPQTNEDFHAIIKAHFGSDSKKALLIDALADGGSLTIEKVAAKLGYGCTSSKGVRNARKDLRELCFLEGTSPVKLTDPMFPFGRPLAK
jgi:hypothetical protein